MDTKSVQALAWATLGRSLAPADAAGVAPLLKAIRDGLAALPNRQGLEPALSATPLMAGQLRAGKEDR